jgi:hypothetical protein
MKRDIIKRELQIVSKDLDKVYLDSNHINHIQEVTSWAIILGLKPYEGKIQRSFKIRPHSFYALRIYHNKFPYIWELTQKDEKIKNITVCLSNGYLTGITVEQKSDEVLSFGVVFLPIPNILKKSGSYSFLKYRVISR